MMASDLPFLNVFSEEYARDPHAVIAPVRCQSQIARSDRGIEVLSYACCEALFRDLRFSKGVAEMFKACGVSGGAVYEAVVFGITGSEGEEHARLRASVMPYFKLKQIESLRTLCRDLVKGWLIEVAGDGKCDFQAVVGRRLPSAVFCSMVGAPLSDSELVAEYSDAVLRLFKHEVEPGITEKCEELEQYVRNLIARKRLEPGDDIVSMLLETEAAGGLSELDIVRLCIVMLVGSTDTTNAQLCMNLVAFARNPDAWELLKRNSHHVPAAVVEAVRYKPAMWSDRRVALRAGDFYGVQFDVGTPLWSNVVAANWDCEEFASAERLDILRHPGRGPLNFGRGRHFCVGRPLSLMVQEETLRAMLELWSGFELAGEPAVMGSPFFLHVVSLPVRFALERGVG